MAPILTHACYLEPEDLKVILAFHGTKLFLNVFMVLLYCSECFYITYLHKDNLDVGGRDMHYFCFTN